MPRTKSSTIKDAQGSKKRQKNQLALARQAKMKQQKDPSSSSDQPEETSTPSSSTSADPATTTSTTAYKFANRRDIATSSTSGYAMIQLDVLNDLFRTALCPDCCQNTLQFSAGSGSASGLAIPLTTTCTNCSFSNSTFSSRKPEMSKGLRRQPPRRCLIFVYRAGPQWTSTFL